MSDYLRCGIPLAIRPCSETTALHNRKQARSHNVAILDSGAPQYTDG
jgi:hypothetical protein